MSKKSRANAAKASETPEVIIEQMPMDLASNGYISDVPEGPQPSDNDDLQNYPADEAGPELPAEDVKLEAIEKEIAPIHAAAGATGLLKVIVNTARASHGTPGSKSTVTNPIPAEVLAAVKAAGLNTCNSVKTLFANGFTRAQIVAAGYNASTVYRQVKEYQDGKGTTLNADAAFEAAAIKIDEAAEKIDENAAQTESVEV